MPQVKNNFLGSKMNKDLDYRLVPAGEYVEAENIQITKSEGSNVGVVQNVKGNSLAYNAAAFGGSYECIGSFFDDKQNRVFLFVTDNTNHKIALLNIGDAAPVIIVAGSFLNFNKSYLITGINLVEDFLFWTDDRNEPRRISISKAILDNSFYNNNIKVNVAKYSPYLAPSVLMSHDNSISSRYIEDKFVRFSYRFKYITDEFSQIAPFTQIAFQAEFDELNLSDPKSFILTSQQVEDAYKQGILKDFINYINKVQLTIPLPDLAIQDYQIKSVDVLIKDANSTAVQILKTIDVTSLHEAAGEVVYTYKSDFPSRTLAPDQVTRVSDNVPIKAKSQEVVGNRIVYGNYTQDYDQTTASYTISVDQKSTDLTTEYPQHSIKQRRNYEIGLVLSDINGRKSPVILSDTSSIYVPAKDSSFESDGWNGDCLRINFSSLPSGDWHSYRVVVKQLEQDYYNVYVPGIGNYKDASYITLIGDNVNKVPRNVNDVDISTNIASSNTRLYPKVINTSYYTKGFEPFTITNGEITGGIYKVVNNSTNNSDAYLSGYISADIQKFTGSDLSLGVLDLNLDTAVTDAGGSYVNPGIITSPDTVYVFVNGEYVNNANSDYTYNYSTGSYGRITWSNNTPISTDKIDVVLKWNLIEVGPQLSPAFEVASLGIISFFQGASSTITKVGDITSVLSIDAYDPYINNYSFNYLYQLQSNADIISVKSIGTINQFNEIDQNILPENDNAGFYKITNNNLIAELPFDASYKKIYDFASNGLAGMAVDLAVFETEPFTSVLDIYYETSTTGLISELTTGTDLEIKFFNTFIIKGDAATLSAKTWHIEESRIRGDFNADTVDIGVQAHLVDPDYKQTTRFNSLIYSGLYNPRTGVNNTNQFLPGDGSSKSLDPQNGSIQKLFAENDNLTVFQQNKVSWVAIDKDVIYTAEGEPQVIASNKVLGQVVSYAGEYGIGDNPESFAYYAGRKYFACANKGVILRLSRDGITEISNYGLRSYFRENLKIATKLYGSWDIYNKVYMLSMLATNKSVAFDEESNGWVSFYPYVSSFGGSIDGSYYTTKSGDLWLHYSNETRNSFYGQSASPSYIKTIVNAQPSLKKNFLTLGYEGTGDWYTEGILTDGYITSSYQDRGQNIAVYNIDNEDLIISAYKKQNNSYVANIINNTSSKENEVIFGDTISGVKGMYMELTMKTDATDYSELFTITSNFNINNY